MNDKERLAVALLLQHPELAQTDDLPTGWKGLEAPGLELLRCGPHRSGPGGSTTVTASASRKRADDAPPSTSGTRLDIWPHPYWPDD